MGKKVLLVDDLYDIRKTFGDLLMMKGYSVTTAEDGEDGFAKYAGIKPDVVLTDKNMFEVSGIDMARRIRKYEEMSGKKSYIILMSDEGVTKEELAGSPVNVYVPKYKIQEIFDEIKKGASQ